MGTPKISWRSAAVARDLRRLSDADFARAWKVSAASVSVWRRVLVIRSPTVSFRRVYASRPIPADLPQRWGRMPRRALAVHYGVSPTTLYTWSRMRGLPRGPRREGAYIWGALLAGVGTAGDIARWAGCSKNNVYITRGLLLAALRAAGKPAKLPVGLRHAGRVSHSPSIAEVEAHLLRLRARRGRLCERLTDSSVIPAVKRAMRQELAIIEGHPLRRRACVT